MNVWISYLIDCMAAFAPECRFDLTERPARKVSHAAIFRPGTERLRAHTLYLCLEQLPGVGMALPEGACFVTRGEKDGAALPNCIVLHKDARQEELLELLLDAMDRYRAWIEALTELSLDKRNPQEYLNASEHMLLNPMLVQDSSYTLIAISRDASTEDYPFFDFDGTMRPMPEFLLNARRELMPVRRYFYDDEGRAIVAEQDGRPQIFYNIISDGVLCANVTCAVTRTALSQGIPDLMHDLCRFMRHSLNLSKLRTAPGSIAAFAFDQLLQFRDPEPLSALLSPKPDWAFVTGTLEMSVPDNRAAAYMLQLQEMLPHSAVCMRDGLLRFVMCVSERETDAVYSQYQYQRLETLAEAMNGRFGLSYAMPDLLGVGFGLKQSLRALELGRLSPADEPAAGKRRLWFYAAAAADDILDSFFSDERMPYYLAPEIAALHRADQQTGRNDCRILYYYLLMGKSLAGACRALHMHRSTIVYRLGRMKELYHLQMDDPEREQHYLLCCRACLLHDSPVEGLRRAVPESVSAAIETGKTRN